VLAVPADWHCPQPPPFPPPPVPPSPAGPGLLFGPPPPPAKEFGEPFIEVVAPAPPSPCVGEGVPEPLFTPAAVAPPPPLALQPGYGGELVLPPGVPCGGLTGGCFLYHLKYLC